MPAGDTAGKAAEVRPGVATRKLPKSESHTQAGSHQRPFNLKWEALRAISMGHSSGLGRFAPADPHPTFFTLPVAVTFRMRPVLAHGRTGLGSRP